MDHLLAPLPLPAREGSAGGSSTMVDNEHHTCVISPMVEFWPRPISPRFKFGSGLSCPHRAGNVSLMDTDTAATYTDRRTIALELAWALGTEGDAQLEVIASAVERAYAEGYTAGHAAPRHLYVPMAPDRHDEREDWGPYGFLMDLPPLSQSECARIDDEARPVSHRA